MTLQLFLHFCSEPYGLSRQVKQSFAECEGEGRVGPPFGVSHFEGIDIPGLTYFRPGAPKSAGLCTSAIAITMTNAQPANISPHTTERNSVFLRNERKLRIANLNAVMREVVPGCR